MATRSLMWFRRDLRLDDHPALAEACAAGAVLPLFVFDPVFERCGRARRAALVAAVAALREQTGGALTIRHGDPVAIVPELAAEVSADRVFVTKDFGPFGRRRDAMVADALRARGVDLRGVGSPYAVEPGSVRKSDGSPYAVFTPFARRWRQLARGVTFERPRAPDWIEAAPRGELVEPVASPGLSLDWERRWDAFAERALDRYAELRDLPALDGTSRLSPHLKFGVVHPRQLLSRLDPTDSDHAAFATELAWRDFYADVLFRHPRSAWANLDRRFDRIAVDTGAVGRARFEAWMEGRTGFPIVDAGMRQLAATGWMHNRVRMIAASFLVKDLHLPWQWGARHFLRMLVDGDLASNNHGWQWAAGSGTDAAPYFRVFNPATQSARYDPDGAYAQRWVPELGTSRYPAPIVDHAAERAEALARYERIRRP